MIFDGVNGYVKGSLNVAAGTVLAIIKGPVHLKNWYNTVDNPAYIVKVLSAGTGKYKLQGTNDVAYASNDDSRVSVSKDLLPTEASSWADIVAARSSSTSGTFSTEYQFLRLVVDTQGTGTVLTATVYWN